ncbi:E3 ubiquitin-protein ligase RNF26-like [Centropristis striata]|uniref:E3 ubiquitin-protein ligase RNF26-like n=1 Tax=Centropristis striata TaxID=184440 RepID=UPI0027E0C600|nr:E3 ubiquitin-protein ligase RNF26-like [Centropristis striata]
MDGVNTVVSVAVGRCVDAGGLLLDLLVRTYGWLLRLLSGVGGSLHAALVALSGSGLVEYWNCAVFCFLSATEAVSRAACGALHVAESWLQALGGVLESFKMVGHLSCHMAWRAKELLHGWLASASCILRQTCEGVCIALSLALYFVNTVVNIVLIGTQNCVSVLAGAWEALASPVHRVAELALTLLTFLYSCLVGASVLLWAPCQLLLDILGAAGRVFVTVFTVDSHAVLLAAAAAILSLALLLLNRRLPVLAAQLGLNRLVAGARRVQTNTLGLDAALPENAPPNQEVDAGAPQEVTDPGALIAEADLLPANESNPAGAAQQVDGEAATTSTPEGGGGGGGGGGGAALTDGELLSLLKEQEERKKCVICQDRSKTVLLLPCRHLCLCRHCADILTQRRPAPQRCCPLCRRPITQTMDVFL